jgi:hypothetical protein
MICGTRDRSGTNLRTVFSGTVETGSRLCTEVAAVVPINEVIRDDMLGEPVVVDLVCTSLAAIGLVRVLRTEAGLAVDGLAFMDDAFIDSMRCL